MTDLDALTAAARGSDAHDLLPWLALRDYHLERGRWAGVWDRRAALDLVKEHRDCDGPRLMFAECCEAEGDGDRAEFVRRQIEREAVEAIGHDCGDDGEWEATCPGCGAYGALEQMRAEEARLLRGRTALNWLEWCSLNRHPSVCLNLAEFSMDTGSEARAAVHFRFRRGFVWRAECPPDVWVGVADGLTADHPVEAVDWVGEVTAADLDALKERAARLVGVGMIRAELDLVQSNGVDEKAGPAIAGLIWPGTRFRVARNGLLVPVTREMTTSDSVDSVDSVDAMNFAFRTLAEAGAEAGAESARRLGAAAESLAAAPPPPAAGEADPRAALPRNTRQHRIPAARLRFPRP